jgi:hypothetical protein
MARSKKRSSLLHDKKMELTLNRAKGPSVPCFVVILVALFNSILRLIVPESRKMNIKETRNLQVFTFLHLSNCLFSFKQLYNEV